MPVPASAPTLSRHLTLSSWDRPITAVDNMRSVYLVMPPLVWLVLSSVIYGCTTTGASGFAYTGDGMKEAVASWRAKAPAETQAVIDRLAQDDTILIHFIRGGLSGEETRGTAATLASSLLAKQVCLMHPKTEGLKLERNWDVIYDQRLQEQSARELGFPSPLDATSGFEQSWKRMRSDTKMSTGDMWGWG